MARFYSQEIYAVLAYSYVGRAGVVCGPDPRTGVLWIDVRVLPYNAIRLNIVTRNYRPLFDECHNILWRMTNG